MGVLSALTTGFYGGLSDRRGRTPIIALSLFGMAVSDTVFLLTTNYVDILTYRFLLVGPIVDGCFGGIATAQAAMNGYISDSSPAGSRAHTFSIITGCLFAGIGLGPTLGGLLIKLTNNVLAPVYVSLAVGLSLCLGCLFFLPESLSKERQAESQEKYALELEEMKDQAQQVRDASPKSYLIKYRIKKSFAFLRPLSLFLPRKPEDAHPEGVHIVKHEEGSQKREWSLTLLAAAYGIYSSMMAIYSTKMLYSQYKFGFGPVEMGYVLTLAGGSRVVFMVLILPLVIRLCRRNPPKINDKDVSYGSAEEEAAGAGIGDAETLAHEIHRSKVLHDSHFDLFLARISIACDFLVYAGLAFNRNTTQFLVLTGLQALGGGAAPAIQSLGLSLTSPKDSGKLFAGLSVLQTLMTQIIGPVGFGLLYATTVNRFAESIFAVGAGLFGLSFVLLMFIRLRSRSPIQLI